MAACQHCGSHVTDQYARVCGDNNNQAHCCPNCADATSIIDGAAARPDRTDAPADSTGTINHAGGDA